MGSSVNETIDLALCSLEYVSVDQVAITSLVLGKGAVLAKADFQLVCCLVPVHPKERIWLGMGWAWGMYVECILQFGLRSAQKIFTAMADPLEW